MTDVPRIRPCGHCREIIGKYLVKCGLAPSGTLLADGTKSLHPIRYEIWLCADCLLGLYTAGELEQVHCSNVVVDQSLEAHEISRWDASKGTGWKGRAHRTHNPGPGLRTPMKKKTPKTARRLFPVGLDRREERT